MILIVISVFAESLGFVLSKLHVNNLPYLHVFTIIEAGFYFLFYSTLFTDKRIKWLIAATFTTFAILAASLAFVFDNLWKFNTLSRTIEALIFTIFGLGFFYSLLKSELQMKLERDPLFWLNSGILLYFMGNFFLFMLYNVLLDIEIQVVNSYWTMHSVINITSNILFTIGFVCSKQVPK